MIHFFQRNRKLLLRALVLGLMTTLILQTTLLAQQCQGIRDNVLRLHVLANSDTAEDQQIKYAVRDALLTKGGALLQGARTKEQALSLAREQLPALTQIAADTLREQGSDQTVAVTLSDAYFDTRRYDTVTLPAGNYTALRVVLGEGGGQNWWCVMFPNLCIPAAGQIDEQNDSLRQVLTEGQTELVEGGRPYRIKFKTVEVVESALHRIKERWS